MGQFEFELSNDADDARVHSIAAYRVRHGQWWLAPKGLDEASGFLFCLFALTWCGRDACAHASFMLSSISTNEQSIARAGYDIMRVGSVGTKEQWWYSVHAGVRSQHCSTSASDSFARHKSVFMMSASFHDK